ncbi:conserved Plasmodium protein, unknown function [Plasmodium sp. gorilla clade G1]|nr:conserved Plasmodium protein, unknown function [Plasmodium sp. gorilla clade G1]
MDESSIKEKLRVSINHMNKRKLKLGIKIFSIEKTVCEIFNIFSKKSKKRLNEALIELQIKKQNCDICLEKIDEFHPFLLYDVNVDNTTFYIKKIEAYCSKCYAIKDFSIFSYVLYNNKKESEFLNFSPIYEHYYKVNNLDVRMRNILENDLNNYFALSILVKNLKWKCSTPHETFEEFLEYSLNTNYKINTSVTSQKMRNKMKREDIDKRNSKIPVKKKLKSEK